MKPKQAREDERPPAERFSTRCPFPGFLSVEAVSRRSFAKHTHDAFGIGVMVFGAQRSLSGRGRVEAEAGQIITVNPNEVHDGWPIGSRPRAWKMLYFEPSLLDRFGGDLGQGHELHRPVLSAPDTASVFLSLHKAAMTSEEAEEAAENFLPIILGALFAKRQPRATRSAGIRRARARIDDAPEAPHPVAELAVEAGLSRWHFIRSFTTATGLTPHAYRRQRQLERARASIEAGLPLSEVAALAGFSDQSHMTRAFSRTYGYTPGNLAAATLKRVAPALQAHNHGSDCDSPEARVAA